MLTEVGTHLRKLFTKRGGFCGRSQEFRCRVHDYLSYFLSVRQINAKAPSSVVLLLPSSVTQTLMFWRTPEPRAVLSRTQKPSGLPNGTPREPPGTIQEKFTTYVLLSRATEFRFLRENGVG